MKGNSILTGRGLAGNRAKGRPGGGANLRRVRGTMLGMLLGAAAGGGTKAAVDVSQLPPPAAVTVEFDTHIRPILESACLRCHGPEKPKSRYRLDQREAAIKGGDLGEPAIVTGASDKSPLIHYVARLVEDMEMPPSGKGEPLTPEQIGLLRAWIDQGAVWSPGEGAAIGRPEFTVTPSIRWFSLSGNERQFREHTWMKDGWAGGMQEFTYREQLSPDETLQVTGRGYFDEGDYKITLDYRKTDVGFGKAGFEQYRKYFDDSGGYYPGFDPSYFELDRDLYTDMGRSWVEFGLTLPRWPRMVLGYEHQYKDGSKSTLQWGDVVAPDGENKKIHPGYKGIDEEVHRIKFDVSHDLPWFTVEDNFRAEFYDLKTSRNNASVYNLGSGTLEKYSLIREHHDHFQAANTLRLERQATDWLFLSGGYLFSKMDGEAGFNLTTVSPVNNFAFDDRYWFTDSIVLDQQSHVFNANALLGPWEGLSLSTGVQSDWMWQRGFGEVRLDEGLPDAIVELPVTVDTDLDRHTVQEHAGVRYTKIPFTVLFAEGRFQQESIGQFEQETSDFREFLRDTDASSDLTEGKVGFQISPWQRVSLQAHVRRRLKNSDYDHERDEAFGAPNEGYPAFIRSRDLDTDAVQAKLVMRPATWLKTTLSYQQTATDYRTETGSYIIPEQAIPGGPTFPAQELAPGGSIHAGNYDAHIYSFNASLTPWRRLYLSGTVSYRDTRTVTRANGNPAVVPYEGEVVSWVSNVRYLLNNATDLHGSYSYSWADYEQDNAAAGLPLGVAYHWHGVHAGVTREIRKNLIAQMQYRFYQYDETTSGRARDYVAHGVFASLSMTFR